MRPPRSLLPLLLVAACCAIAPSAAEAKTANVRVGIGDQNATMFDSPLYTSLQLKRTRYFIAWNAIDDPGALAKADAFVDAASRAKVQVLMHISTDDYVPGRAKLPSVAQYNTKVGALIQRYRPRGVREWGAWNEANHRTEPTYDNPKRAAQFYLSMRKLCSGCTLVALDIVGVLNARKIQPYVKAWLRALPKKERARALTIGIHQYWDPNNNTTRATSTTILAVRALARNTRFWITETGGLAFVQLAGTETISRPCSLAHQAVATKRAFAVARAFDKDVERMYTYSWTGTDCTGYDAGLVNADGTARPALREFTKALKGFRR